MKIDKQTLDIISEENIEEIYVVADNIAILKYGEENYKTIYKKNCLPEIDKQDFRTFEGALSNAQSINAMENLKSALLIGEINNKEDILDFVKVCSTEKGECSIFIPSKLSKTRELEEFQNVQPLEKRNQMYENSKKLNSYPIDKCSNLHSKIVESFIKPSIDTNLKTENNYNVGSCGSYIDGKCEQSEESCDFCYFTCKEC